MRHGRRSTFFRDRRRSPAVPLDVGDDTRRLFRTGEDAARVIADVERRYGVPVVARPLTQNGNLEEAARNLFTSLRELDAGDVPAILAAPPAGNEGLALAIADRLRRASH